MIKVLREILIKSLKISERYRWVIFTSNFAAPKRLDGKGAFSNISCSNMVKVMVMVTIPIHAIICIP